MISVSTHPNDAYPDGKGYFINGLTAHDMDLLRQGIVPTPLRALAQLELYGPTLEALDMDLVRVYLKHGKPIQAIKHVRQLTHASLKQAKEFIDELKATMDRETTNHPF